jgi:hypothetical protein
MHRYLLLAGQISFVGLLFLIAPLKAENPQAGSSAREPAVTQETLELQIQRLASSEFSVRREAFMELWRAGTSALPLVSQAKSTTERQVAEVAKVLEILIELEISPGERDESARLLDLLSDPTPLSIVQLCEMRHWRVCEHLIKEDSVLAQKFQEPYGRYLLGRLVDSALRQGDPSLAWPLVRDLSPAPVATWIGHKTGLPSEPLISDDYSRALQLFYEANIEAALDVRVPAAVHLPMITRSASWSNLLDERVQQAICGRQPSPVQLAVKAVLHEVAGDLPRSTEIWDELLQPPRNQDESQDLTDDPQADVAFQMLNQLNASGLGGQAQVYQLIAALLFGGRSEPIELYLMEEDRSAAFGFFLAGNNYEKAFESLGIEPDLSNLESWLDNRRGLISLEFARRPPENRYFDETARLCSTLSGLGFADEAKMVLDELVALARLSRGNQPELWSRSLIAWLARSEARVMVLQAIRSEFGRMNNECQTAVLQGVFGSPAMALWKTAPGEDFDQKWENLERLWLWDRSHFDQASRPMVAGWLRQASKQLASERMTAEDLSSLADIAVGFGDSDLALELLTLDVSADDSKATNLQWVDAAEIYIQRGMPENGLKLLRDLRQADAAASGATLNLHKAYVTEIEALLMHGRYDQAKQLDVARWLRPLATTRFYQGAYYLQSARQFVDENQFERAAEYAEPAFLLAASGSMDVYWAASDYGDILKELGNHVRNAEVQRAAWVEALQPYASSMQYLLSNGYFSSLRFAAQKEKLSSAVACIEVGDIPGAEHNIRVGGQLQPQDIEMVVQCYPRLMAAGEQGIADQLFDSYEERMQAQIARWPKDATALNNLAWMYAQCDRELEQAMTLVRRAVELAPHSAVFLDTLAEVEFRSGMIEQALETARACVRLDPRESHYRQNLIRFRAAIE